MLYVILILIIVVISAAVISGNKESRRMNEIKQSQIKTLSADSRSYDDYYVGQKVIGLSVRKGYNKFSIAGAYYRNLSIDMVGKFNGYAIAQTDNEHDPFAIAIFNDEGTHLGFLPQGNKIIHQYIMKEGGKVHAYGYLGWNDGAYGEVCIETDKNLVTKRNKPYGL